MNTREELDAWNTPTPKHTVPFEPRWYHYLLPIGAMLGILFGASLLAFGLSLLIY